MSSELIELAATIRACDTKIRIKTTQAKKIRKEVIKDRLQIGKCLIKAKQLLGHGKYTQWLQREFAWSLRSAQRYVRLAEMFAGLEDKIPEGVTLTQLEGFAGSKSNELSGDEVLGKIASGEIDLSRKSAKAVKAEIQPMCEPSRISSTIEKQIKDLFGWVPDEEKPQVIRRLVELLKPIDRAIFVTKPDSTRFVAPSYSEVVVYVKDNNLSVSPDAFIDHYAAQGWYLGNGRKMRDWTAAIRQWHRRQTLTRNMESIGLF